MVAVRHLALLSLVPLAANAFMVPMGGSLALRGTSPAAFCPVLSRVTHSHNLPGVTSRRRDGRGQLVKMQSSKSAGQQILVVVLFLTFLFTGLYPLINNSLKFATADKSMSGAATKMRQSELDDRLRSVPIFSVTDAKGTPYIADTKEGETKGFFFLDSADATAYLAKVKELQGADAVVKITPTTLDRGIAYIKGKKSDTPFEIFPGSRSVQDARAIKNPEGCDICWGNEGVEEYVPVFWVKGLGLEVDNTVVTPIFFDKGMALDYYTKLGKSEEPDLEVFDLSALIKKIRKGGSTEFRKVSFYPSRAAVEFANSFVADAPEAAKSSDSSAIFPEAAAPAPPAPTQAK